MNILSGKIALITGATSGIGEASAKRFAQAGAIVLVCGRNRGRGERVVSHVLDNGGTAVFYDLDVSDSRSIENLAHIVREKYGFIDILFNNAGVFPVAPSIEDIAAAGIREVYDTNVTGLLLMLKFFMPLLREGGCILNTASVAGLEAYTAGQSYAYCASKAAVIKITKMMAKRYAGTHRVNAIVPGVIKTPIFKHFDEARMSSGIPMGRVGMPEEIASAANFLVSADASFINGAVLTVDGGQSL